jgi:hypothetical protein
MKRLGILVGVFVALLLVLLLQRWQRREVVVAGPAATIHVDPDKTTRVKIHRKDGDVELERTGSVWKLVQPIEYPANAELVQGMLKGIEDLKLEDVISSNPANRGTYQVDSTGTAVEIWSGGDKALAIVVGKSSSDWTHTFVRYADRDEVYRASGVISYNFNRRADEWRDKTILKFEEKDVHKVTLGYPKEQGLVIALARADSVHWDVQEGSAAPARADSATAARLVAAASRLMTVNFATPEEAAGKDFGQPDFVLGVEAAGTAQTVRFVAADDSKMLAKLDGNETLFSLYKGNLNNLMKKGEELRTGKAPEVADQSAAKKGAKKKT